MRKHFVIVPCFLLLAACVFGQTPPPADQNAPVPSSAELWDTLMRGNESYVDGRVLFESLVFDREKTAPNQNPPVTILSCADSRVPPELAFHRTVGDLFVARVAGNVADVFTIASIEYAIGQQYTRMIVVLGHEECGAVTSAMTYKPPPPPQPPPTPIEALLRRIRLSFPAGHCDNTNDPKCVRDSVELNTRASAKYLIATSPIIKKAVCAPQPTATLVTAYYNLVSGQVKVVDWPRGDGPCK